MKCKLHEIEGVQVWTEQDRTLDTAIREASFVVTYSSNSAVEVVDWGAGDKESPGCYRYISHCIPPGSSPLIPGHFSRHPCHQPGPRWPCLASELPQL